MKQTEIGLIPDDWEVKRLGELCSFHNGVAHEDYVDDNGEFILVNSKFISSDTKSKKYSKKQLLKVEENTILMVMSDVPNGKAIAKCFLVPSKFQGTLNQRICMFSEFKMNRKFAYRIINRNPYYLSFDDGIKQTNLRKIDVLNCPIPLPPLPEQQRIAKALSDVDVLISTIEKLLQKKRNIKQGTMQELLTGKKRLPGFAKSNNTKMTELGEIPEDWEVKTLSEIFEFKLNNTFTRDCLNDSKGEYQNVHYGDVLIKYSSILDCSKESIPFINEGINVKFPKYGIMEGDIIIADTAEDETVGKAVEIYNLGEKKIVSGLHTFLCRKITDDFAPKWIGYFMNQAIFHNQLLPFITGTKVSAISRTAIQNVKVLIPPKEEQNSIAKILSDMDNEIDLLNTKLEKYRNLKTAMMQQLLTGKIRLIK